MQKFGLGDLIFWGMIFPWFLLFLLGSIAYAIEGIVNGWTEFLKNHKLIKKT